MNRTVIVAKQGNKKSPLEKIMFLFLKAGPTISKLVNQISNTNTKSLGNPREGKNAGRFFAAFQFTDIDRVQVGFLRQLFLTQFGTFSKTANGFANDFLMSQSFCHAFSGKQEAGRNKTVHSPLFLSCKFFNWSVKTCSNSDRAGLMIWQRPSGL